MAQLTRKQDRAVLLVTEYNGVNWGRGANIALRQLLQMCSDDVRALQDKYAHNQRVPINTVIPQTISVPLINRRNRNRLFAAYYRFERFMGMKLDYIETDPVTSAKNIIRHREKDGIRRVYEAIEGTDIVVIDVDGDLIFRANPSRVIYFHLAVAELAHSLGKEVHWVNSIFSDCPATGRNSEFFDHAIATLTKCSTVALRDPASIELASSAAPRLQAEYVPDSLFHWYDAIQEAAENLPGNGDHIIPFTREEPSYYGRIRFDEPYICIAGGSRAAWDQQAAIESYTELVEQVKELGAHVYLTPTSLGDQFMYDVSSQTNVPIIPAEVPIMMAGAILSEAKVLVTGRYHPAIFASLRGTPCVFLGADSHKTRSLQDVLKYEDKTHFPALPEKRDVDVICQLARQYMEREGELRTDIRATAQECAVASRRVIDLVNGDT